MVDVYLLTEECPRKSSICKIIEVLFQDFLPKNPIRDEKWWSEYNTCLQKLKEDNLIDPIYNKDLYGNLLSFNLCCSYKFISGYLRCFGIRNVYISIVKGQSSFCDYLLYYYNVPDNELSFLPPNLLSDIPAMIIEETKTSDKESRNTGVYQRAIKFAYAKKFYPTSKLYMLYNNDHNPDHSSPTDTNIFGTNILLTLGVTILGKEPYMSNYQKFNSIDELVTAKNSIALPQNGQPIRLTYNNDSITISCRLNKNNSLSHDPNIGTIASIVAAIRKLNFNGKIVITSHQLNQQMINNATGNKLIYICKIYNVELKDLVLPQFELPEFYWIPERRSEKIASIYLHILAEKYRFPVLYHNHAGCERSYYLTKDYKYITIPKETEEGEKILIPDLIVFGKYNITVIEGKKLDTLFKGLNEVDSYGILEDKYIKSKDYGFPGIDIYRALTIYGGELQELPHERVLLYINNAGKIIVNPEAPYPWNIIFKKEGLMDSEHN